ncbi:hypothetical protein PQZ39_00085 [bacterium]|nr:hypothetical protein [bacterium]
MGVLDKIKKGTLPTIIAISALSVSASAAFYSVSGLSKLFAGASFEVTIMAASLEVAKLVIASLLYQYWTSLNKLLRTYLTVAAFILVLITSMGIYGFLSAAYQDTYRQLTIKNNQVAFLEQKTNFYEKDVARYDEELERIANNISTLSNAKASSIQVRDTTSSTGFRQTISTTELRLSQKRIDVEEQNRASVQAKREQVADSLQKYQLAILDLENNVDVAGELGPLEYLSGLTGTPMDKIINILLLVIIFVFDPLAISLVVAANFAFSQAFPKKKYRENLYGEQVEVKEIEVKDAEEITTKEEFLQNLDNIYKLREEIEIQDDEEDDIEWSEIDLNKDGKISQSEIELAKAKIAELKNILETRSLSAWRRRKISEEIQKINDALPDDDLTITY